MNPPIYLLRECPPDVFRESPPEFRHARKFWESQGLWPVVDRVHGNGTLVSQGDFGIGLLVWPAGNDCPGVSVSDLTHTIAQVDDGLSVAWRSESVPGPDDLDNGNPLGLRGTLVELADGNFWEIPQIREPGGCLLPRDITRNRLTRELQAEVQREYLDLWNESAEWIELFWAGFVGERASFGWDKALAFATKIIGLRYRFCDATQSALRILDTTTIQRVISVAVDFEAIARHMVEAQKKSG